MYGQLPDFALDPERIRLQVGFPEVYPSLLPENKAHPPEPVADLVRELDIGLDAADQQVEVYLVAEQLRNNVAGPAQMAVARALNGVQYSHMPMVI